jgi:hypothetical protein
MTKKYYPADMFARKRRTHYIRLGSIIKPLEYMYATDVHMPIRYFGVHFLFAKSRTGKSALAKHMICQIAKHRPCLIFDYRGEYGGLKYRNALAEHQFCIPDLVSISNFGFKLSDFEPQDFLSLGFTEAALSPIYMITQELTAHNNDPQAVFDILCNLPTGDEEVQAFNRDYGMFNLKMQYPIHEMTKRSLLRRFHDLLDWFIGPESDRTYIANWGEFIMNNPHVRINLNIEREEQMAEARATCGIILRQLVPYLKRLNPVILMDEFDKLAPAIPPESMYMPSSLSYLLQYALKFQAYGVVLIGITQDERLVYEGLRRNWHSKILGKGCETTFTGKLHWDYDKGIRQFIYLNENTNFRVFEPDIAGCKIDYHEKEESKQKSVESEVIPTRVPSKTEEVDTDKEADSLD